jgi:hypothetical protein
MTSNLPAAGSALYTKLSGASTVTDLVGTDIWRLQAPEGTDTPYIVYYSANAQWPNTTPRDDVNDVFRVECVGGTRQEAENVLDAAQGVLHEQSLTIPGWSNYWLACERVAELVENHEGRQLWRYVGDYRMKASKE